MVLLNRKRLASALTFVYALFILCGCSAQSQLRNSLAEANSFSCSNYHLELVAHNGISTLAYQTDVTHTESSAEWKGTATVGAYGMAFQQDCHSIYSKDIRAKEWRGQWVVSNATSPKYQIDQWLQAICRGSGTIFEKTTWPEQATASESRSDTCITVQIPNAPISWDALADVHIDSSFGTQSLLTSFGNGTATLYFDALTHQLNTVIITAGTGQNNFSCIITVSAADAQTQHSIPVPEAIGEGTLYEEWTILDPSGCSQGALEP